MKIALLASQLLAVISIKPSRAAISDKQFLSELSFKLSGRNLNFPCENTRTQYESTGRHVSRNTIATRAQIHRDEAIVAMPRYKHGVPITLGVVSLKTRSCEPTISPFPSWSMQEEGECEALQSVVDLTLDAQDLLWVLDVGIANTLEQPVRRCPPKVVAIDVKSRKVVKVVELSQLASADSRLQYLAVDYAPDGELFLYISDAAGRAILVYNVSAGGGHRISLPKQVAHGCARPDVLYLALVRKSYGAAPVLYLTYLGSERLFSIETRDLRRKSGGSLVDVGVKSNEIVLLGTDNGQALFFRNKGESDVYMWNTETAFRADNFLLVQKGNECRLPTQVLPGYKRLLWVIESNFHDYLRNTVSCNGASVRLHPLVKSCEEC